MNDTSSDKRAAPRFLAGVKASLRIGGDEMACSTADLSREGVLLEAAFDVVVDVEAAATLQSTAGDLILEVHGRVAHVSKDDETGHAHVGLQFDPLDEEQKKTLDALLSRVIEGTELAPLAMLERDATVPQIREALGKIRLPHRILLAQRAFPMERGFLRHDESPQVLEALCRNPRLTLPEVIQILRLPTLLPTTLDVLSRDGRWIANEEIKITIATHPRVTFPVADRLVKTLTIVGIRKVIRRPGLNQAIKNKLVQSIPHKQLQGW